MFVDKLKLARGSDASNAHDEEPCDDEVEFSDDEQEAAYKRMLKERFFPLLLAVPRPNAHKPVFVRRSGSRPSSRATTPGVPTRRDYDHFDDTFRGNNPYDEHGAYDMNYGAGPSRPPPMPYDDPYSDSFTDVPAGDGNMTFNNIRNDTGRRDSTRPAHMSPGGSRVNVHTSDRNLDPGLRHHTRGRGRGGRNRQSDRGRRGRGRGAPQHPQRPQTFPQQSGSHDRLGPTPPGGFVHPYSHQRDCGGGGEWSYSAPPQPPVFGFGLQNPFPGVQPHINPKFANQLGFNFSQAPPIPQISPGTGSMSSSEQYDPVDVYLHTADGHHRWTEGSD